MDFEHRITLDGDEEAAARFVRFGQKCLDELRQRMELPTKMGLEPIFQSQDTIPLPGGGNVFVQAIGSLSRIEVFMPVVEDLPEGEVISIGEPVLLVRFIPSGSQYATDQVFIWNIQENDYMPIPGFSEQDVYEWGDVGGVLLELERPAEKPCYDNFANYGINSISGSYSKPSFVGSGSAGGECPDDPGKYWLVRPDEYVYNQNSVPFVRPDGVTEYVLRRNGRERVGFTEFEDYGSAIARGVYLGMDGIYRTEYYDYFPSYQPPISGTGSLYAKIQTVNGNGLSACFPYSVYDYTGNDYYETQLGPDCWWANTVILAERTTVLDRKSSMTTPLGTEALHKGERWYYEQEVSIPFYHRRDREISTTYSHYLKHDNSGFYKKIMYQISTGMVMRIAQAGWEEYIHDYDYPHNPSASGSSNIYDMVVKCIAGCEEFTDEATDHNPKNQVRNTELEAAVVSLITNSTKQEALDDGALPGNIEAYLIEFDPAEFEV